MIKLKKLLLIVLISLIEINVKAAGSINVSENSITLKEGETKTFTISAENAAGVVGIKTNDTTVATVSESTFFFDSSLASSKSIEVSVTGIKEGQTTIIIELNDVATFDMEELTGTKTIEVIVEKVNVTPIDNNDEENNEYGKGEDNVDSTTIVNNVPKTASKISIITILFTIFILACGIVMIGIYNSKKNNINN